MGTAGPLPEATLGDDFPGDFPARFMRQAWGLEGPHSPEGAALVNATGVCTSSEITDEFFGQAMFEYVAAGVMHEWRCPKCPVKRSYVPERIETNGKTIEKYWGPDLHKVDAKDDGMFRHDAYSAGDMFINAIGDVHQSYTVYT